MSFQFLPTKNAYPQSYKIYKIKMADTSPTFFITQPLHSQYYFLSIQITLELEETTPL